MWSDHKPGYLWSAWAAVAVALCLCVAAYMGWGRGLPPMDSVIPPTDLPQLPDNHRGEVSVLDEGSALLQRPLFHPSRLPQRYLTGNGGVIDATESVRLSGVVITPEASLATLNGPSGLSLRLQLGAPPVQGWQLLELLPRQATVSGPNGIQNLLLTVHEVAAAEDHLQDSEASMRPAQHVQRNVAAAAQSLRSGSSRASSSSESNIKSSDSASESESVAPSTSQLQLIQERIRARKLQMQKNTDGTL